MVNERENGTEKNLGYSEKMMSWMLLGYFVYGYYMKRIVSNISTL